MSAHTEAYEEVILALQTFMNEITGECSSLKSAITDCVDNMDDDINALKLSKAVAERLNAIYSTVSIAADVKKDLRTELDKIKEIERTNSFND